MAQSSLFESPTGRLGARLHSAVFGELPTSTARALDVPEVAAAVRPLLDAGWRPAQLAARVGALPVTDDPVTAVAAFLAALRQRDSPQRVWEREQDARRRERAESSEREHAAASEQSRDRWAAQTRQALGLPPRPRAVPAVQPRSSCAACGAAGTFFVTRQVRLCARCVDLLAAGEVGLGPRVQAS